MDVRSKLAQEWSDQKEARFKQFTDRFEPVGSLTCGLVTSTSSTQKSLDAQLRSALLIHRASADHPFDALHPFGLLHQGIHVCKVHLTCRWGWVSCAIHLASTPLVG